MGKLPRRIETPIGFVYILKGGYYPCGDKDDQQKLLAIGEIFSTAVEKGAIVIHDEKRRIAPNLKEARAFQVLLSHVQKNYPYSENLDTLLSRLAKKSKKKFFYISIEELEKILGKDWELELFAGEMSRK